MVVGALVSVVAMAGVAQADQPAVMLGAGSLNTFDAMQEMDIIYNESAGCDLVVPPTTPQWTCVSPQPTSVVTTENYYHDVAASMFSQGTSAGLRMLCQGNDGTPGTTDIGYARSSTSPSSLPSICNVSDKLTYVGWAKDAIAIPKWLGGASEPVTSLSHSQIKEIFTDISGDGCAEDWGDFGGTPGEQILVHGVEPLTSSFGTFQTYLGGNANYCALETGGQLLPENDCTPINDLPAGDRGRSIWWVSYGKYATGATNCTDAATDLIGVNGVAPSAPSIQSSTYQYTNFLYNVYRRPVTGDPVLRWRIRSYIGEYPHGWLCRSNSMHIKPVGDPGLGVPHAGAERNYGLAIDKIIDDAGFVRINPLPDGDKCVSFNIN
ncbi:hypothetical protein GCM10009555_030020 [Acrocarpospora macrocephala]|uniref:PBP domain-containing protein n=1 Tax=Acrocarpospora macrocephala TaxID=150177 RepID=A0A5M3X611_9ACTN|nr:hypothetical protein Amac_086880 [Acrocarpospora macrocephala]